MKILKMVFLVFWLLLIWVSMAQANTYWVSNTGGSTVGGGCADQGASDPNVYYRTINAGIACMSSGRGDTVIVKNGTYDELMHDAIPSGNSTNYSTVRAQNPRGVTIRPSTTTWPSGAFGAIFFFDAVSVNYVSVQGFVMDAINAVADINQYPAGGTPVYISGTHQPNKFQHLQFINNDMKNSGCEGIAGTGVLDLQILNNDIHDDDPTRPNCSAHGIYISDDADSAVIDGNRIWNKGGYGVHLYCFSSAIVCTGHTVKNNLVWHNGYGNQCHTTPCLPTNEGNMLTNAANVTIYNNVVWDGKFGGILFRGGNGHIYSNSVWSNGLGGAGADGMGIGNDYHNPVPFDCKNNIILDNSVNIDPAANGCANGISNNISTGTGSTYFVNATLGSGIPPPPDLHLKAANGAGANLGAPYNVDKDGNSRPSSGAWDAGAYQYISAAQLVVNATVPSGICNTGFTTCTITSPSPPTIIIRGTSSQTGGTVSCAVNRQQSCTISGNPTLPANWTTNAVTLKSGINTFTISATDGSGAALPSVSVAVTFIQTFPGNSLVAAYGFEDGSGFSATDSSGNSNTGTLTNGVTWSTNGKYGKALGFVAASSQYVSISGALNNSLALTQSFTLSAWVAPTVTLTNFSSAIYKNGGTIAGPYELYASSTGYCGSGALLAQASLNGSAGPSPTVCGTIPPNQPLPINTWTHIAATFDGTSLKLYQNAVLLTTTPISPQSYMEPTNLALIIGGSENGEYFQGLIDEVRVYNYALPVTATAPGSTGNTTLGAPCDRASGYNGLTSGTYASITGDANCPVVPLAPPLAFKVTTSATGFKIGASSTGLKVGSH